jgi:PUA domain protein
LETYPGFEPYIEEFLPKKASLEAVKLYVQPYNPTFYSLIRRKAAKARQHKLTRTHSPDRVTLYTIDSTPLFFQPFDGPPIPHLKLVHAFPSALPTIQIDRGAIRFVLSGAALMAPGLTSPGGSLPDAANALEAGSIVAVKAEGKEEVCLVGALKMGTEEMKSKGKGVVMDEGHYLGDGLWKLQLD